MYSYEHRYKKKNQKNHFGKDLFKLMNNAVFRKIMWYVKKHKEEGIV